jgi:hypothetical protein
MTADEQEVLFMDGEDEDELELKLLLLLQFHGMTPTGDPVVDGGNGKANANEASANMSVWGTKKRMSNSWGKGMKGLDKVK